MLICDDATIEHGIFEGGKGSRQQDRGPQVEGLWQYLA